MKIFFLKRAFILTMSDYKIKFDWDMRNMCSVNAIYNIKVNA